VRKKNRKIYKKDVLYEVNLFKLFLELFFFIQKLKEKRKKEGEEKERKERKLF
jgi:hypothetical protein